MPVSVFVLIDALGWQLLRDRPIAADILPFRQEVETVFGFSSAAIPSILSGMLPREHQHWNLFVYDPPHSPFRFARPLRHLPSSWVNSRLVRKAVSLIGRKMSGTRGYFQVYGVPVELLPEFDVCEKEDIYGPRGLEPTRSIFDLLEQRSVPYRAYSYHQYSDERAVEQATADLRRAAASFYFVYLAELDAFLHKHVHQPGVVDAELERYETYIRRLFSQARQADPEVSFYVCSDHGMTEVTGTYDLMGQVRSLGFEVPRQYLALYDSTMARFWFFDQQARAAISDLLASLPCGHVVSEQEQRAFGVDFGHNRFGDLIFLMNEGVLMHPSHMGRVPWPGMHGFHPQAASSSAVLLARREPPVPVHHVRDLFALMCHEAGLR